MINGKTVLCEVGCGPLSMCYGKLVWGNPNLHVILFEPHPKFYADLKQEANGLSNVEVHNVAIGDENGVLKFVEDGPSSSLNGVDSPLVQHRGDLYKKDNVIDVQVRKISEFDFGQIDILRVDTEGAEWFCLKHLKSRPKEIVVEIYNDLATYINPYLFEIEAWAKQNNYKRYISEGDFIYVR
jgi:FkbM family methyltransferase